MSSASDLETSSTLLRRLKGACNAEAWNEFVQRYAPRIYAWCRRLRLQDADAQDVSQEVLTKLVLRMRTFEYDPGGSFRGWLKTVTVHAWDDFLAERQQNGGIPFPDGWEPADAGKDLAQELEEEFQRELLEEALARVQPRVEPRTWEAFRLLVYEKLSGAEVAGRLGMRIGAVYRAKNRVLVMLREEVQKLEPPEVP